MIDMNIKEYTKFLVAIRDTLERMNDNGKEQFIRDVSIVKNLEEARNTIRPIEVVDTLERIVHNSFFYELTVYDYEDAIKYLISVIHNLEGLENLEI